MSEQNFTPGPWIFSVRNLDDDSSEIGILSNWHDSPIDVIRCGKAPFSDSATANARLIAAAPDLLAELQRLREKLQAYLDNEDAMIYLEAGDDIESIDAVIAKAKGVAK